MPSILVATDSGCRVFSKGRAPEWELAGQSVSALALDADGGCVAIVDEQEIWKRDRNRIWRKLATAGIPLQSLCCTHGVIFGGGRDEAAVLRVSHGAIERSLSFDDIPGRDQWFAGGPPLGVRSLAATRDEQTLLAAVHVGGMPRSQDGGKTWTPTIPVMFDVHEVCAHPSRPNLVAAAAAVGLCLSKDGGEHWRVMADGLEITNSLAVAALETAILFSIQDGPFAERSQIWRWNLDSELLEQVRDGLPDWLEGKVDTAHIATSEGRAAICDRGGNLWVSTTQTYGWKRIADGVEDASGILIL